MSNEPQITRIEAFLTARYLFRYNYISNEFEYKSVNEGHYEVLRFSNIIVELKKAGFRNPKVDLEDILGSSYVLAHNPFFHYFENLPVPDVMEKDYIKELASFVKVAEKDREEFDRHFRKMLIRCVACSKGIAFNKQAFILIGKQNDGKTTFLRFLCPPALDNYITESFNPDEKDAVIALCQNFMINLDELANFAKSDINKIKNLISTDKAKVRKPYASKPEIMKRLANFVGSTNETEFLTDPTGTVRWICFEILGIDFSYKNKVDIDKVWAQANKMLYGGHDYKLSPEELAENEIRNETHKKTFTELELIRLYFCEDTTEDKHNAKTATDVQRYLTIAEPNFKLNSNKIGEALKMITKQKSVRVGNKTFKGYYLCEK